MAQADTRIALQGQTANYMLPSEALSKAYALKNQKIQSDMAAQEMTDNALMDQAYRAAGGDISKMQADPGMGFRGGMQIAKMSADRAAADARAEKEKMDFLLKGAQYTGQLASSINDQAGWDNLRRETANILGPDALTRMPEKFSYEARDKYVNASMSFADRIAQQRADQQNERYNQMHLDTLASINAANSRAERRGDGGSGDARYNTIYDTQGKAFFVNPKDPTAPPIPIKTETGDQFAKPPAPTKAFTQDQSKAAIYGKRIEQAASILDDIGSDYNPTSIAVKGTLEDTPLVGKYAGIYANSKIDPKSRQVEQAQLNILNAILRQESGATIGSPEFKKAEKQYFIVPGDDEQTKANKRQNLQTVIAGMKNESGPAWLTDEKVDASNQNPVITHPKHGEITEDDIQTTMKARNMTREQVLQKLGGQ